MARINGKNYSWSEVEASTDFKNIPMTGVAEIDYNDKQEVSHLHAKGNDPIGIIRGKKEPGGKLTLLQGEFQEFITALTGSKNPLDLPEFNLTISYAPEDGPRTTDQCIGVVFESWGKKIGVSDPSMKIELPFKCLKIVQDI